MGSPAKQFLAAWRVFGRGGSGVFSESQFLQPSDFAIESLALGPKGTEDAGQICFGGHGEPSFAGGKGMGSYVVPGVNDRQPGSKKVNRPAKASGGPARRAINIVWLSIKVVTIMQNVCEIRQ